MALPATWCALALDELCVSTEQVEPSPEQEFVYIDISAVDRQTKRISAPQRLLGRDAPSRARKLVQAGDTLVSMTRPNLNAVALVNTEFDGQIASTGFDVLRAPGIESRWIAYIVRSQAFVEAMSALVQGALYPAVSSKHVRSFTAPVAPRAEQQRIADKLDTVLARVDACRDRLARIAPLLKRFRQSVLAAATSGKLTENWRTGKPVGNAASEVTAWILARADTERKPPAEPDLTYWKSEVPAGWVVASAHQFAECLDRLRVPIKREDRKSVKGLYPYYGANGEVGRIDEYIFDDELVLVTEDETFYGREKPIAYRSSGKCWVNNHAHVLRARSRFENDYLCFALMHYDVSPWLTGTTGRAKLTQQALNALPLAIPPSAELLEVVRRVEALFAFADRLEARLAQAQTAVDRLTPSLLAKAFRGELVPQDPADEPAAELLKRLAASRTATAPKTRKGRQAQPT